jgi:hypothetical protein
MTKLPVAFRNWKKSHCLSHASPYSSCFVSHLCKNILYPLSCHVSASFYLAISLALITAKLKSYLLKLHIMTVVNGRYSSTNSKLGSRLGWVVNFRSQSLYTPPKKNPSTYWLKGWMGCIASLHALENGLFPPPGNKTQTSVVQYTA